MACAACHNKSRLNARGSCAIRTVESGKDFAGHWFVHIWSVSFPVLVILLSVLPKAAGGADILYVHKHKQLRCHAKLRSPRLHLVWLITSGGLVRVQLSLAYQKEKHKSKEEKEHD